MLMRMCNWNSEQDAQPDTRKNCAPVSAAPVLRKMMRYVKYHALGNDYVVIPTTDLEDTMKGPVVRICSGDIDDEMFKE